MASAFAMFAIAFGVFILSAEAKSFVIFLLASFICGTANTFLQAAINPYVTILGPTESAAKRISIMGMINKLAWPVSPLFIALFASNGGSVGLEDLSKPFLVIIGLFVILGIVALVSPLPEVKAAEKTMMLLTQKYRAMPIVRARSSSFLILYSERSPYSSMWVRRPSS